MDFTWKVQDETHGSDYFPILIKITKVPRWKLDKEIFKEKCKNKLTHIEANYNIIEDFTETLIEIAKDCVPRNSTPNKRNRPWFDNECQKAIRLRRAALKKFQKEPTTSNLIEYQLDRAKAHRVIKNIGKYMLANWLHPLNQKLYGKWSGKILVNIWQRW